MYLEYYGSHKMYKSMKVLNGFCVFTKKIWKINIWKINTIKLHIIHHNIIIYYPVMVIHRDCITNNKDYIAISTHLRMIL